jgi:hypothetical protein
MSIVTQIGRCHEHSEDGYRMKYVQIDMKRDDQNKDVNEKAELNSWCQGTPLDLARLQIQCDK